LKKIDLNGMDLINSSGKFDIESIVGGKNG